MPDYCLVQEESININVNVIYALFAYMQNHILVVLNRTISIDICICTKKKLCDVDCRKQLLLDNIFIVILD